MAIDGLDDDSYFTHVHLIEGNSPAISLHELSNLKNIGQRLGYACGVNGCTLLYFSANSDKDCRFLADLILRLRLASMPNPPVRQKN
jgi:hypothetical protein